MLRKPRKAKTPNPAKQRKGQTAMSGGQPFPTVRVAYRVHAQSVKKPPFSIAGTIPALWGNDAPECEMAVMRAANRRKILARDAQSKRDAAAYLRKRILAA